MRIIAGRAKGRSIDAVASATRPTSDRAREALFSTLASEFGDFDGLHVLDLYAGTGAIALEALSRGASLVHAVEKDESAAKAIESNFENLKSAQCPGIFHLYTMGVHRFLQDKAQVKWPDGLEQIREKNYGQASIFYGSPTLNNAQNG